MDKLFGNIMVNNSLNAYNKVITENGSVINKDTCNTGVTAFNKIIRISNNKLTFNDYQKIVKDFYKPMIEDVKKSLSLQLLLDTFILPFYKRCFTKTIKNMDGSSVLYTGEGERALSYHMFVELLQNFPETTLLTLRQFTVFGYWGDLYAIWDVIQNTEVSETLTYDLKKKVFYEILSVTVQQMYEDKENMKNGKQISLVSKWFPREKSSKSTKCVIMLGENKFDLFTAMSIIFSNYSDQGASSPEYMRNYVEKLLVPERTYKTLSVYKSNLRKSNSELNKYIDTFEIKACSHNWSKVDLNKMPSRAMLKNQVAFLNETNNKTRNKNINWSVNIMNDYANTGNRYPNDEDRINARNNLIKFLTDDKKIKVSGIEPHEILKKYMESKSSLQKLISRKQWEATIEEVFNQIVEVEKLDINDINSIKSSRICSLIPMMDISGSMVGIPIDVSIGLGLFIIGLQKRMGLESQFGISFSEVPQVLDFTDLDLDKQIEKTNSIHGLSTNFEAAIDIVLDAMKKTGLTKSIIAFTDGQFNVMNKSSLYKYGNLNWTTCHNSILQKVATLELKEAPNIIYWNLRCDTAGVQTEFDLPGVQLLQGYSPALIKFTLFGDELEYTKLLVSTDDGQLKELKVSNKTPYDTYRQALDQECFNEIKYIVKKSNEGFSSLITV